jgi:hypothetical protein
MSAVRASRDSQAEVDRAQQGRRLNLTTLVLARIRVKQLLMERGARDWCWQCWAWCMETSGRARYTPCVTVSTDHMPFQRRRPMSWATLFLGLELAYCGGNFLKVGQGGWVPLVLGGTLFVIMVTWR